MVLNIVEFRSVGVVIPEVVFVISNIVELNIVELNIVLFKSVGVVCLGN